MGITGDRGTSRQEISRTQMLYMGRKNTDVEILTGQAGERVVQIKSGQRNKIMLRMSEKTWGNLLFSMYTCTHTHLMELQHTG